MRAHMMKAHKHTAKRIEADIRRHRKSGGPTAGNDEAEEDLRDRPEERTNAKKIDSEAEATEAKRGGKVKKHVGKACGGPSMKHGGRKPRASGGGCESNPFTHANKGTGRKVEKETEGRD